MPWARLDDSFSRSTIAAGLSIPARLLLVDVIVYAAGELTDGVVSDAAMRMIRAAGGFKPSQLRELEALDFVTRSSSDWILNGWESFARTNAEVTAERVSNRERKARFDAKSRSSFGQGNGVTNSVSNGRSNSTPSLPVPSRPVIGEKSSKQLQVVRDAIALAAAARCLRPGPNVKDIRAWTMSMPSNLEAEFGGAAAIYLGEHPEATARDLALGVMGVDVFDLEAVAS
jgi:hypothetical protein